MLRAVLILSPLEDHGYPGKEQNERNRSHQLGGDVDGCS